MDMCWPCCTNGTHRNHPLLFGLYCLLGEFEDNKNPNRAWWRCASHQPAMIILSQLKVTEQIQVWRHTGNTSSVFVCSVRSGNQNLHAAGLKGQSNYLLLSFHTEIILIMYRMLM